jgi:hypothetical protein
MNSQEVNHNRVGCCMTTTSTTATTTATTNKESLLGRRRQIQLQQQREDEGRHPKMMTMLTMRHKCNTTTTTTTTSNVIPRNNYVERLSVQLPVSPVQQQQQQQQRDPNSGVDDDDVLRLVIHVEETQPDEDDEDDEEEEEDRDDEKESFLLRRKVGGSSWNEKENRRMLKKIGRQRSASLELKAGIITTTPPPRCDCPTSTEAEDSTRSFEDDEKTCPSVVIPPSTRSSVADRLSPGSHPQCHNNSSIRNAAGRSNVVVKEFRRSSELLRNILLSLSASSASSRRSSDGSTVSSFSTAAHYPSGPHQQQQQQTFLSATESTSYYSSALQAHRKRRWTANNAPQDNSDATTTTTTLGSSGHAGHTGLLLLFDAIASSNWTLTSQLLDSGVVTDVNAPLNESNGYTALHWCAVQTPVPWPAVFLLLENGCRVEQRDKDGTQPVFLVPNLPKIQQQLVNDAFDYLVRGGVDLPPPVTETMSGEEADPDEDAPVTKSSSSGMGSCAGVGSAGGVAAGSGGGAVNNIFRRLQQSVIINQAGHYLHQHTTGSGANVNKKTLHDASSISPSAMTSTSIDYDPFEITSIKV